KGRPGTAALDRNRTDLNFASDQKRLQTGIHERGQRGREGLCRARPGLLQQSCESLLLACRRGVLIASGWPGHRLLEATLDAGTLTVDCLHIAALDLLLERRVRNRNRLFGVWNEQPHHQIVEGEDEQENEPC